MSALVDWLLGTLPPEAGPVLQAIVAHWDVARQGLIAACLGLLLVELLVVREALS